MVPSKISLLNDSNLRCRVHDTRVYDAAKIGNLYGLKECVDVLHLGVDDEDDDGYTPLMIASSNGHLKMVKLLIENGANANIKNVEGETASMIALRYGHLKIVEALKDTDSVIANADDCLKILKDAAGICCIV